MKMSDLVASLSLALKDTKELFEGQLEDIIGIALRDFSRYSPLTLTGSIDLVADVDVYEAPDNLIDVKVHSWGRAQRRLPFWDPQHPRTLPRLSAFDAGDAMQLRLSSPPSAGMIGQLGAKMPYFYYAEREIDGDQVPVRGRDADILLVRAQAEVMRQLANHHVNRPVATRDVVGSQPRNGTPAALCELYLRHFQEMLNAA